MNRLARHIVLLIAWVLAALPVAAQPLVLHGNVTYQPEYYSLHPHAQIVEDAEHRLGLEDVITPSDSLEQAFMPLETEVTNLDFTSSSYWVRFDVANASAQELNLILEVARPLTNRADLYVRGENGKRLLIRHGDALPFHNRQIKDPRLLFPLRLAPGITYHYYLHLESDGEIINLPLRLWQEDALLTTTTKQHYFFGVYYGTQLLVFLLFLFFYLSIRERSFLLYTIYVLALMLLQLGLDGLAALAAS
ncbi:MAG: 7TM-DISM domain-containing protein, partial [Bacteroidota bacterium]